MKSSPFAPTAAVTAAVWALSAAILGTAAPASAHHSFAMYDREKTLTLSGTVKEYFWASPHVTIQILSDDAKGGTVAWAIEGSSPAVMTRDGWTNMLLRPGDRIALGVHPRKDGHPGGLLADDRQVLVNGQAAKGVLFLGAPGEDNCAR